MRETVVLPALMQIIELSHMASAVNSTSRQRVDVQLGWDKCKFNDNTNPGFNGYGMNGDATLISIAGLLKF